MASIFLSLMTEYRFDVSCIKVAKYAPFYLAERNFSKLPTIIESTFGASITVTKK